MNIAYGTARLGLTSAVITGVGDEHIGRFIVEQLAREGVDTRGVKLDPERLTALVILGIRDREHFPLIFYRENCADMALCQDDIHEDFVRSARSVVVTGTHLSHPRTEAAVLKALRIAREAGIKTALDIDYRPSLWGVAGHGEGESRFVESAKITAKLQSNLHLFDLIVGTEEESHRRRLYRHRDGAEGRARCLGRHPRQPSAARLARLPSADPSRTALMTEKPAPASRTRCSTSYAPATGLCPVFLRAGSTRSWPTTLKYANACGAFAVSRHGCTPAYPSGRSCSSSSRAASSARTCATTPSSSRCTGRPIGMATGRR